MSMWWGWADIETGVVCWLEVRSGRCCRKLEKKRSGWSKVLFNRAPVPGLVCGRVSMLFLSAVSFMHLSLYPQQTHPPTGGAKNSSLSFVAMEYSTTHLHT